MLPAKDLIAGADATRSAPLRLTNSHGKQPPKTTKSYPKAPPSVERD